MFSVYFGKFFSFSRTIQNFILFLIVFSQTGHEQPEYGISFCSHSLVSSFSLTYAIGLIKVISHLLILFTGGIILSFLHSIIFIIEVTTISSI
ncbi:hypothetical protein HOG27_05585 [bacterium]|nr:hypothetical protein [bacterium]MBT3729478.1 hypothetical protein [bacterium]MBT6778268.1 hypothetical protein [bacterium]